jgi:hypothetical protein
MSGVWNQIPRLIFVLIKTCYTVALEIHPYKLIVRYGRNPDPQGLLVPDPTTKDALSTVIVNRSPANDHFTVASIPPPPIKPTLSRT